MTADLLDFVLAGSGREQLSIAPDGSVRYLVLTAAHPDRSDHVGSYTAQLTIGELDRVRAIAADLLAADPVPRDRSGPIVTATGDGREVTHALTSGDRAAGLLSELIERARAHPYAVLRLTPEVVGGTGLRLVFAGVGRRPVTLQLAGPSIAVATRRGEAWTPVWHSDPQTWLFLVDPQAQPIDGIELPTVLAPGAEARLHLGTLFTEPPEAVSVSLDGWLEPVWPTGADGSAASPEREGPTGSGGAGDPVDDGAWVGYRPGQRAFHLSALTR